MYAFARHCPLLCIFTHTHTNTRTRTHTHARTVQLHYYGRIKQSTGEDWENASLSLSTAEPSVGGSAPCLGIHYIQFRRPALSFGYGFSDRLEILYNLLVPESSVGFVGTSNLYKVHFSQLLCEDFLYLLVWMRNLTNNAASDGLQCINRKMSCESEVLMCQ